MNNNATRSRGRPHTPPRLWVPWAWVEVADVLGLLLPEVERARPIVRAHVAALRALLVEEEPPEPPEGLARAVWAACVDGGLDCGDLDRIVAAHAKGGRALTRSLVALHDACDRVIRHNNADRSRAARLATLILHLWGAAELSRLRVSYTDQMGRWILPSERIRRLTKRIHQAAGRHDF